MKLKKDELVAMASDLKLAVSGTKQDLAQRIIQHKTEAYDNETDRLEDVLYHTPEEDAEGSESPSGAADEDATEEDPTDEEAEDSDQSSEEINKPETDGKNAVKDHVVFEELPSRLLVAGGLNPKVYLTTLATVFLLMFGYGFQDYYGQYFSFEGDDKKTVDCIHITYHSLGYGNSSKYDPTNEANIECAEFLGVSPNYWQEEMDAWIASLVGNVASDGNHTGFVWTQAGIVGHKPTGFLWTQAGIDTMTYLGATTFNANMSVYGDPVAGDVFTEQHLAVWNGFGAMFPGGGNDTIESLLPGGNSPFAIYMPSGIVEHAPTGYLWSHPGVPTMAYLGSSTFGANMSVFGDPAPGDVFTADHLAVWNGFTATVGGGNDTFASLLPGGDSPFAVYMPAGIVITEAEWTNQTPSAVNLTISSTPTEDGSGNTTYEALYEFVDAQGDNDSSTVMWFVNGTYATNTSTYSAALTNGSVLSVRVTPHDGLYTGSSVDAELVIVVSES